MSPLGLPRRGSVSILAGAFGLLVAIALAAPGGVLAVSAVDQSNTTLNNDWLDHGKQAQTFTVGVTGALDGVDLETYLNSGTGTLYVDVEALDGSGNPNGTPLTNGSASVGSTAVFTHVTLPNLAVTVGQQYAIVFYVTDLTTSYNTVGSTNSAYAGGVALFLEGTWQIVSGSTANDWGFRTYVDPAVVASPSAAATVCESPTPTPTATATATATPVIPGVRPAAALQASACATPPPTSSTAPAEPNRGSAPDWLLILGLLGLAGSGTLAAFSRRRIG